MNQSSPETAILAVFDNACGPNRRRPTQDDLPATNGSTGRIVNRMEAFWTKCLHLAFQSIYDVKENSDLVVLSRAYPDREWNRNEFLHDLSVVERRRVRSAYDKADLPVARRILWQVESELDGNGREVAIDFSKLIAGSAENKLMIVRQPMEWQTGAKADVLRFFSEIAVALTGNLFLAFLPAYSSSHRHLGAHWIGTDRLPFDLAQFGEGSFQLLRGGWEDWPQTP